MSTQDVHPDQNPIPAPLRRIPESVRDSLTPQQAYAVSSAVQPSGRHPVDLRLTLPLPGRPVFFSIVAGREQRSDDRLAAERRQHPLHTLGNVVFMISSLTGFYTLGLLAVLMMGSVLDY